MHFLEIPTSKAPMPLLWVADPSEENISDYLPGAWCFAAKLEERIVGVCIAKATSDSTAEIFNISIYPELQQQGIGSGLLNFALAELAVKEIHRVELGTGTFGYQLTYYQRLGFRVDAVIKDHFLHNYPQPIYENGIQHKDRLRLYIKLSI